MVWEAGRTSPAGWKGPILTEAVIILSLIRRPTKTSSRGPGDNP